MIINTTFSLGFNNNQKIDLLSKSSLGSPVTTPLQFMKNANEGTFAADYFAQTKNHFFLKSGKAKSEFHRSLENLAMYKGVEIPSVHELCLFVCFNFKFYFAAFFFLYKKSLSMAITSGLFTSTAFTVVHEHAINESADSIWPISIVQFACIYTYQYWKVNS